MATGERHFRFATFSQLPTTGLLPTDTAQTVDDGKRYRPESATSWREEPYSVSTPGGPHTHPESDVIDLVTHLSGKAASSHAHATSDVTGLDTALSGKAPTGDGAAAVATHNSAVNHALLHSNALDHSNSLDHSNANDHTHSNKATLDAYTQTNADIADAVTKKHSNADDHANSRANGKPVYAALANDTLAQAYATNSVTKLTVTAARTLTTTVPPAGCQAHTIILTSGTASYTITFGTGFKPTGTLATGTVSGKVFVVHWISDGTNLYESGRTAAMTA
jgi:hypothetical protein